MLSILKSVWRRAVPLRYRDRFSGLWQRFRVRAALGLRRLRFRHIRIQFGPSAPRKVFLIVIDCLRRDALSFHGNPRSTTPFLDNLVQSDPRALALHNFYGSSSWTYPAVVSILSGLYPHNHGGCFGTAMREMNKGQIPNRRRDDVLLLPDAFHKNGYVSYFMSPSYHASRGAEAAFQRHHYSKALTEEGLFELLEDTALSRPWQKQFFYAHTMALHTPAPLPLEYQKAFDDHTVQPEGLAADWKFKDGNVSRNDPAFQQYRHERLLYYDRALRLTDDCLKRLFDRLARAGLLEQSMFVITSDHGEEFWEHVEAEKEFFTDPSTWGIRHGHNLYQEVIHLPATAWKPS
ncbi:MAG: sulfatase-like hydrolase/transferase [Planctomycetota bacterium]|jgi:arylsulfatase A-like enzyme